MADGKIDFTKGVDSEPSPNQRLQELQAQIERLEVEREALATEFKTRTEALDKRREELLQEAESFKDDLFNSMKSRLGITEEAPSDNYGKVVVSVPGSWVRSVKTPDRDTQHKQVVVNLPAPDGDWKSPNVSTLFMDEMRISRRGKQAMLDFTDKTGSDTFRYQERRGALADDGSNKRVGASRVKQVSAEEMADIVLQRTDKKPHFVADRERHINEAAASMQSVTSVVPEDVREKTAPAPDSVDASESIDIGYDVTPFD